MDKMPLVAVVFQSFPESVLLFALGLTLIDIPLRWSRIVSAAAVLSAVSYFIRGLPLPYGTHTLLYLLAMCLLLIIFFRAPLQLAATAALLSVIALGVLEIILWPLIFLLTGLPIQEIWARPALRVLIPLPELVILAAFTWWCRKKKITLSTPWTFKSKAHQKKQTRGPEQ